MGFFLQVWEMAVWHSQSIAQNTIVGCVSSQITQTAIRRKITCGRLSKGQGQILEAQLGLEPVTSLFMVQLFATELSSPPLLDLC